MSESKILLFNTRGAGWADYMTPIKAGKQELIPVFRLSLIIL